MMPAMAERDAKQRLKEIIQGEVFVTKGKERIVSPHGGEQAWLFDFRNILLVPAHLDLVAELFLEEHAGEYPFQVGCIETAAIPLVAAIAVKSVARGKPVNAFYIRKSRKKEGLMRMIEGRVTEDPIVLVDDIINSGKSFLRQIEALAAIGKGVREVFALIAYRDPSVYDFAKDRGIKVRALFSLAEFGLSLAEARVPPPPEGFSVVWRFASAGANFFFVNPKSAPVLDEKRVYVGSDAAYFWALNQEDGSVAWKTRVGFIPKGKAIFSTPALHDGVVYFGAYDGNVYALEAETGKKKWIFMEADWVGSSPALAPDLGLLFIGLEFGLFRKRGGIAALRLESGEKVWEFSMPEFTHGSPGYSRRHGVVLIGSNDGVAYAFRAKDGKPLWQVKTGGPIKGGWAIDEKRGLAAAGSFDGAAYVVRVKDGSVAFTIPTSAGIYSTPLMHEGRIYAASLDKKIYCANLDTGDVEWSFYTSGRIFSSPTVAEGSLFIGSNDGRLYELDPETGRERSFFQAAERIVNAIAYNPATKRFFVPTFANELYCLVVK